MSQSPSKGTISMPIKRHGAGRFFIRGLGVVLPSVLTLWILVAAFRFIDSNIAAPINAGVRLAIATAADTGSIDRFLPTEDEIVREQDLAKRNRLDPSRANAVSRATRTNVDAWWSARWYLELVGLALAIVAVYLLGRLVGGFLGRKLLSAFEAGLLTVPGIRSVYPALKQVVEFLFGSGKQRFNFNRVVLVEYPRAGMWSIGLVTGDAPKELVPIVGDSLTVFMPNSPTPFTGWTITVPRSEVREVSLTIDEALRYLVSAGVIVPEGKQPTDGEPGSSNNHQRQ
ncbi:MAG: DUF502 domain-containing protein [Planctomycetota bacterium]|jgi:uncharacterized membrane protein|nr:MAG: DUF502 domain-containing protein [Planctomycetota bacterium]